MNTLTKQTSVTLEAPKGPVLVISPGRYVERDSLLRESSLISVVDTPDNMQMATATLGRLDALARAGEKEGEDKRRPFAAFAKKIKAAMDGFLDDVNKERSRIGTLIADRANAERRAAAELEAKRQRDIQFAEARRREIEAGIEREQMKARTDSEYEALEEKKRVATLESEREQRRLASVIESPATPGVTVRAPVWKFRVLDVDKLPPEFVKKVPNEIALQVAVDRGVREIAGCEMFEETVRAFTRGGNSSVHT